MTASARVVEPPAAPPPAPVAPPPPSFSPPAERAPILQRAEAPKKPAAKPQRARAATKKRVSRILRATPIAEAANSSPDGTLLAGGLALLALIVGESIFLTLSVRFLRIT